MPLPVPDFLYNLTLSSERGVLVPDFDGSIRWRSTYADPFIRWNPRCGLCLQLDTFDYLSSRVGTIFEYFSLFSTPLDTMTEYPDHNFEKLPDHLITEIFVRVPISQWATLSRVKKKWADIFKGESLWHTALLKAWPCAGKGKRWPGPIPRGPSRRRYAALYASEHSVAINGDADELAGHVYLYLKEQLELDSLYPLSSVLHGTMIDQFIACGNTRDRANELASQIWLAVVDHLEENERTFVLLKHLALEEVFLRYPYSRSDSVQWRVFDRLFTDFRDCFSHTDYCDILGRAKYRFSSIPSTWLGH